jgi:isocitrate dehydrogenase kinase/phosphatase
MNNSSAAQASHAIHSAKSHQAPNPVARARDCALTVVAGFQRYDAKFSAVTNRAMDRFAERDWQGSQQDSVERVELHDQFINQTIAEMRADFADLMQQRPFWQEVKRQYAGEIRKLPANELCCTFFSCMTRRLFKNADGSPDIEFGVIEPSLLEGNHHKMPIRQVPFRDTLQSLAEHTLRSLSVEAEWRDEETSAKRLIDMIRLKLESAGLPATVEYIETIDPAFYRFTSAYVLGRIVGPGYQLPLAMALSHTETGLVIDDILLTDAELRHLFRPHSFPFHVDLGHMAEAIRYLKSLMPETTVEELFAALGRAIQDTPSRLHLV